MVGLPWRKLRSYVPESKSPVSLDLGSLCTSGTWQQDGPHQWSECPSSPQLDESRWEPRPARSGMLSAGRGWSSQGAEGRSHLEPRSARQWEQGAAREQQEPFMPEAHSSHRGHKSHSSFEDQCPELGLSWNRCCVCEWAKWQPVAPQNLTPQVCNKWPPSVQATVMLGRKKIKAAAFTCKMKQLPYLLQKIGASSKSRELQDTFATVFPWK